MFVIKIIICIVAVIFLPPKEGPKDDDDGGEDDDKEAESAEEDTLPVVGGDNVDGVWFHLTVVHGVGDAWAMVDDFETALAVDGWGQNGDRVEGSSPGGVPVLL